jgi:hypothetical protein
MKKLIVALAATLTAAAIAVPIAWSSAQEAPQSTRPVVATFDVAGQKFKLKFTKPADIALARRVLAGKAGPVPFPAGKVVYGTPDVNTGYTWHLDNVTWTEAAMEICDGKPGTDVETRKLTSTQFCPWGAKLISLN